MRPYRLILCGLFGATMLLSAGTATPLSTDPLVQKEFDRFVDLISGGMWPNGAVSSISAKPDASDEALIDAAAQQLNFRPAPLKEWHILKVEHLGPEDFQAVENKKYPQPPGITVGAESGHYLVAVIDSDQGHKVIGISEVQPDNGSHWARMYNCDANFSSPQAGGTPLIRTDLPK